MINNSVQYKQNQQYKLKAMSQQRNAGFKKFKSINETNSASQWESYSKNRQNDSNFRKRKTQQDDGQWIGSQSTPPRPDNAVNYNNSQSFQFKQNFSQDTQRSNISNEGALKSPTQLIQDILKGFVNNGKMITVNPYYSEQSQEKLTQILTNQNKLQKFISDLQSQMSQLDSEVVKNYQMLIILLKHVNKSDVEVKHSSKGLELNFNRNIINKQENQIQKLQKKIKQKDDNIKQIVEQYETVIKNFNDVIEKLLEQKLANSRSHYHEQGHHHQKRNHRNENGNK